jgi:polyphosphate:AMP phosphotransferase
MAISKIVMPLDPRRFNVYSYDRSTEEEQNHSFLWAYWTRTPSRGRISIYDRSWLRYIIAGSSYKLGDDERNSFYTDVNSFEKQLTDDGTVIIKIFLHISREEQTKRYIELEQNPETSWRVDGGDWEQNKNYHAYISTMENLLLNTQTDKNKWNVIEADDKRYTTYMVYKYVVESIEKKLNETKANTKEKKAKAKKSKQSNILDGIDVNKDISETEYKRKLELYQSAVKTLNYRLFTRRRAMSIVYEGWDAAGKGGNIKRLTEKIDPRGYEVVPISAPTQKELDHHYLWRFYRKMPRDGNMSVFDRSWYGRVLVERVEGFCTEEEWKRAYDEINDMERHLTDHGMIIIKFWLQIDKEEQLKRFNDRQNDPLKQYKITDEDWRNREKWEQYECAVMEMLEKTNTPYAPWIVIESNNKKYARIKVLEKVVKTLEKQLR